MFWRCYLRRQTWSRQYGNRLKWVVKPVKVWFIATWCRDSSAFVLRPNRARLSWNKIHHHISRFSFGLTLSKNLVKLQNGGEGHEARWLNDIVLFSELRRVVYHYSGGQFNTTKLACRIDSVKYISMFIFFTGQRRISQTLVFIFALFIFLPRRRTLVKGQYDMIKYVYTMREQTPIYN